MSGKKVLNTARSSRLMPALLDRLTDHEPLMRSETPQERMISRTAYRESVLRDLSWLLNTVNAESASDFLGADRARLSVVNFGVPGLSGRQLADDDWMDVEKAIRLAITTFEPRILPDTLQIRVLPTESAYATRNQLSMEIKGQLWCEPYPIELLLRSHIDLECGQILLENMGSA
ncbi:type VI secretion system baseplate subunit TssE [Pseudomonas mangiferae]|uniref:Type VI secretion system baseplate subunit TssE n=1 Tax=Pseudomonas mangiferae TaxID=2593654 RepID=A0A553H4Y7_9PSED|nr:type VI secretion system baseplate subunit TssE [Pseudomonas mangiferae]TRX76787.1 type VI secretion system baseplate subunit TssE [Pseudomonas mangiferae]